MSELTWDEFEKVEMRVGTILSAEPLPNAHVPAIALQIDFGPLGIKQSSARIVPLYQPGQLPGRQVIAVVNFPPKRIAGFKSECLVLGVYAQEGVVLLQPEKPVSNGDKIG